jgi:hypothetical protein
MSFQPVKAGQFQPVTATSPRDCVPATTAQLINRATVDAIRTDHAVIRAKSGAPATRGLFLSEAVHVAASFGVKLSSYTNLSRNALRDLSAAGRGVGILINCSITRYTDRRTNSYTGPHMVYANAYSFWQKGEPCACELHTAASHGEFTIDDPGTTSVGFQQWSANLVYRAAEAYPNGIGCLATLDTEGRTWTARTTSDIRSLPSYTSGVKIGSLVAGQAYIGGRTDEGGQWQRADKTYGRGWVHVKHGSGWGWCKGSSLA